MSKETPPSDETPRADAESLKLLAQEWWIVQLLEQREATKRGTLRQLPTESQLSQKDALPTSTQSPLPQGIQGIWNSKVKKSALDVSYSEASQFILSDKVVEFFYRNQAGSSIKQRLISLLIDARISREKSGFYLKDAVNDALVHFFDVINRNFRYKNNQEYPLSKVQLGILQGGIHFRLGNIGSLPEGKILADMIMREFLESLKKGEVIVAFDYEFETYYWFQDEIVYIKHVPHKFDPKEWTIQRVKEL